MSAGEMRKLITSMRARETEVKKEKRNYAALIKDEAGGDEDEVTAVESRPVKRPRQSFDSGVEVEVVDLTGN